MNSFRIVGIKAENIKKLTVVDISPKSDLVKISGANEAGKSSLLDAIEWVFRGGKSVDEMPITHGKDKGNIKIDVGEYVIEKRFTKSGQTLTVTSKDGAKYPSPQKFLDAMQNQLSFDPLKFAGLKSKEQTEILCDLLGLDFSGIEARRAGYYQQRTFVNRDLSSAKATLNGLSFDDEAPDEVIDIDELINDINVAGKRENERGLIQNFLDKNVDLIAIENGKIEQYGNQIIEIQENINEIRRGITNLLDQGAEKLEELDVLEESFDENLIPSLREKLTNSQSINKSVADNGKFKSMEKQVEQLKSNVNELNIKIRDCDTEKQDLIKSAKFPIDGLSLTDDATIILNDIPLKQCSSAQQLKASAAMAMAMNPTLRVLRIKDGSLLDDDSMTILEEMAFEHDFQVWLEIVDTSGDVGFYMVDGEVARENEG